VESAGAVFAGAVAASVGPFAKHRLDQTLRFAVGAWSVDARVAALDPELDGGLKPGTRVVGLRIVGQHAFDFDAVLAVPGVRALEEAATVVGVLAG
jgi:hypothetical protein